MGAEPDQMAGDALQLEADHADQLRARRHVEVDQFLDRQAEGHVVRERREVVHAVGRRDALLVSLVLYGLLNAGVQEAHIRHRVDDLFAVQLQQHTQHAMRAGMMRPHVEEHGLAGEGAFGDQAAQLLDVAFPTIDVRGIRRRLNDCHVRSLPTLSRRACAS